MSNNNLTPEKKVKPFREDCLACEGTGKAEPHCGACEGNGWVHDPEDDGTMTCPECDDAKCTECEE